MTPDKRTKISLAFRDFAKDWRSLQDQSRYGHPPSLKDTLAIVRDYERLSGYLYAVRAQYPSSDPFRERIEDLASNLSHELLVQQKEKKKDSTYGNWVRKYRAVWKENLSLFLFTVVLFLSSLFIGWHVTVTEPEFAAAFVPQAGLENVLNKHKWFEDIQSSPLIDGISIASNNIMVGVKMFVGGAFLGVGGLLLLIYNGLLFGALMAFCYVNQFNEELTQFVIGHGPLELTIIVASAFASFIFGRVFFMRPYSLFRKRLSLATRDASILLTGILPWLILAAFIEVFVSPWPEFSTSSKLLIGLVTALGFWLWTLWPSKRLDADGASE